MPRVQNVCSIIDEDPVNRNTCTGHSRNGLRCRNPVSQDSRRSAHSLLRQCTGLPSDSVELHQNFKVAAGLLLCKRNHQYQASDVVSRWLRAWELNEDNTDSGYASSEGEQERHGRRHPPRVQSSRQPVGESGVTGHRSAYDNLLLALMVSGVSQTSMALILETAAILARSENSRTMAPVRGRTTSNTASTVPRTLESGPPIASVATDRSSGLHRASPEPMRYAQSSPTSNSTQRTLRAQHSSTGSANQVSSSVHPPLNSWTQPNTAQLDILPRQNLHRSQETPTPLQRNASQHSTQSVSRVNQSSQPSGLPQDASREVTRTVQRTNRSQTPSPTIPPPVLPAAPHVSQQTPTRNHRESHVECGVCYQPYQDGNHWECSQCQNRTHLECYQTWVAHLRPSTPTCVYCRIRV